MITLAAGACQGLMRLNEPPPAASAHLVAAATHSGAPWEWGSQVVGKKNHNRGVGNNLNCFSWRANKDLLLNSRACRFGFCLTLDTSAIISFVFIYRHRNKMKIPLQIFNDFLDQTSGVT